MEHVSKYFEGITPNQSMQSMLECAVSIEQILYVAANWHSQDEEETLQQAGQEAVRKPWKTEERHWTKQVLASPRITLLLREAQGLEVQQVQVSAEGAHKRPSTQQLVKSLS